MANERVNTYRNAGTSAAPQWEKYFIKTLADCIMMSDTEGETKTIKDYVDDAVKKLVNGAPEELDTLKEIADAIASNQTVVDAINASITNKVDKVSGKGLSTNDYTTAEKTKLSGIETGAEKNKLIGIQKNGTDVTIDSTTRKANITVPTKLSELTNDIDIATSNPATSTSAGLMSAADKAKLDGIAEGANNYTHPTTSGNKHIPTGGATNQVLEYSADGTAKWGHKVQSDVPANAKFTDTTYSAATASAAGLMSAADKAKVDAMPTISMGATAPTAAAPNSLWFEVV